jgi:hypothetical protein
MYNFSIWDILSAYFLSQIAACFTCLRVHDPGKKNIRVAMPQPTIALFDLPEINRYTGRDEDAASYQYIEQYDPVLFQRIGKLVAQGKWHIMGGSRFRCREMRFNVRL